MMLLWIFDTGGAFRISFGGRCWNDDRWGNGSDAAFCVGSGFGSGLRGCGAGPMDRSDDDELRLDGRT